MPQSTPRVTITHNGHVAEVMLNRPDKRNAMDEAMFTALSEAGEALQDAPGLRAVILHGAGDAFCAGIDVAMLAGFAGRLDTLRDEMLNPPPGEEANRFQKPCTIWADLPVPVIAAVHGVAFGAGLQLALGADFRLVAPEARLSIMESKWGLIPDMGLTRFLPALMRADQAKALVMTARVLDGIEAVALGLATQTAPDPLAEARALADHLAARSPDATRHAKTLVNRAWHSPEDGLALEAALQAELIGSPNQIEAVMANMQGRAPEFGDPDV